MGLEIRRYTNFIFKVIHPVGLNNELKLKQKPSNKTL